MPIHIPSKRYNEDLPKSVEVDFVDRFRELSWCVRFVYRRQLWNDSELPWQHFRWRYKKSNIENTIKFVLTSLWYNVSYWLGIKVSLKDKKKYIYSFINQKNFSAIPNFFIFSSTIHISIITVKSCASLQYCMRDRFEHPTSFQCWFCI